MVSLWCANSDSINEKFLKMNFSFYKPFPVLLFMLFMYIYLFLFFQTTLFLKKEDKKKKSIKNITKVVEICDKTVLEPFGIFQKKGSLPRRELLFPLS